MNEPVSLPQGAKPSKVVSKDEVRPILTRAEVKDGHLYATDSYCAIKLPVELEDGPVPRGVLEAAEKPKARVVEQSDEVIRVELKDGTIVEGATDRPGDFPNIEKILSEVSSGDGTVKVALNPELLSNVAKGLGANRGVVLSFDLDTLKAGSYNRAMHVAPFEGGGEGILMAIRRVS